MIEVQSGALRLCEQAWFSRSEALPAWVLTAPPRAARLSGTPAEHLRSVWTPERKAGYIACTLTFAKHCWGEMGHAPTEARQTSTCTWKFLSHAEYAWQGAAYALQRRNLQEHD